MELGRAIQQQKSSTLPVDATPDQLVQLIFKPIPTPSPGHVIVRMLFSAINPIDIIFLKESRLSAFQDAGAVPGSEGVGIVHQVGEGVASFQKGERVVPIIYWNYLIRKGQGAWQDYIEVSESDLVSIPESVSNESASLYIISPWTVFGLLWDLAIPKGEYLLQTTGGSVIGRMVIQLGKYWGIKTISIIRREEWREELYGLGADEIINSTNEDIRASVMKITKGRGAYAAIDMLAGNSTKVTAACVRDYGNVYVFGTMLSHDVVISASDLMRKVNVTFWNLTRFLSDKEKARKLMEDMPKLFENRILTPLVGKKFSLNNIKEAILESQRVGTGRKVLLSHD